MKAFFPLLVCLTVTAPVAGAADWAQFRGPNGSGLAPEGPVPAMELAEAWKAKLPGRGLSSPIIVGDNVFVTCSSGPEQQTLHVICFASASGEKRWERTMRATGRTMTHKKTCVAAPTPCSDGQRVYALFSSNDLLAYDLDGNLQWLRGLTYDYPNASNSLGMASSPVVVDGTVVVQAENDSESLALGIDAATGVNRWKMERPKAANWTSAVVVGDVVALQSSKGLTGVKAATGEVVWNYADGAGTIPSTGLGEGVMFVPSNGLTALTVEGGSTSQLWRQEKLKPGTASPVVAGGSVYVINGSGVLVKASATTGEELSKGRLKGPLSGSPVIAGDRLFVANEQGEVQVVDLGGETPEVVHTLDLDETVLGTPAIADAAVFLRSDGHLWRLQ